MRTHSLILLLRTFTEEEIKQFGLFIRSPYFSNRKAVEQLHEILIRSYPEFSGSDFTRENIFKELFRGKKYNDSTFRVLVSNLNELAVKFLTIKSFENDQPLFNLTKARILTERDYYKGVDKMISDTLKKITASKTETESMYSQRYDFLKFRVFYFYSRHSGFYEKFNPEKDLMLSVESLTNYYYISLLKTYLLILNLRSLYIGFDASLIEKFFNSMKIGNFANFPVILIYYYLVKLHTEPDNYEIYFSVKKLFLKNIRLFYLRELAEIFINLENYCSRNHSAGSINFAAEKFEWLTLELKYKTYFIGTYMPVDFFRGVISSAVSLEKFRFAREFVDKYSGKLDPDSAVSTVFYCSALIEFNSGNYEKALGLLSRVVLDDHYLKLDVRVLRMMIYFEMNFHEPLLSDMESFRHFLMNNKIITETKMDYYKNFYKAIRKLFLLEQNKDGYEIEKFRKSILSGKNFINKSWVIEKINALELKK